MNNFSLLDSGIDTVPLMALIDSSNLWNAHSFRKTATHHREASDIIIRFDSIHNYTQGMTCIDYPAALTLGQPLQDLIDLVLDRAGGKEIGRIVITKLEPGARVYEHVDTETSVNKYKRYHICLTATPGNCFTSGEETIEMVQGQLWWFENKIPHSCINNGVGDRVHLILDVSQT